MELPLQPTPKCIPSNIRREMERLGNRPYLLVLNSNGWYKPKLYSNFRCTSQNWMQSNTATRKNFWTLYQRGARPGVGFSRDDDQWDGIKLPDPGLDSRKPNLTRELIKWNGRFPVATWLGHLGVYRNMKNCNGNFTVINRYIWKRGNKSHFISVNLPWMFYELVFCDLFVCGFYLIRFVILLMLIVLMSDKLMVYFYCGRFPELCIIKYHLFHVKVWRIWIFHTWMQQNHNNYELNRRYLK